MTQSHTGSKSQSKHFLGWTQSGREKGRETKRQNESWLVTQSRRFQRHRHTQGEREIYEEGRRKAISEGAEREGRSESQVLESKEKEEVIA